MRIKENEIVERMGLSLYKRFGYPDVKELGLDENIDSEMRSNLGINIGDLESVGEIYRVDVSRLSNVSLRQNPLPDGKSLVLFTKDDLKKLHQQGVGAVELVITNDQQLLIMLHWLYGL